jgi:plastocyanin
VIAVAACTAPAAAGGNSAAKDGNTTGTAPMEMAAPAPGVTARPPATGRPQRGDAQVKIVNFTFSPAVITVHAGQTVEWTNRDAVAHTVDLSGVISNVLNRGDTYTQRFTAPGTYRYICSIHPFMRGTVVVTA